MLLSRYLHGSLDNRRVGHRMRKEIPPLWLGRYGVFLPSSEGVKMTVLAHSLSESAIQLDPDVWRTSRSLR